MTRSALALLVALAGATALAPTRPAEACSPPPAFDVVDDLTASLTDVPITGIVPIYVLADPYRLEPGYPQMTVLADGGVEVPGTLEVTPYRLIWRADETLAPNTTYEATLLPSSWESVPFTFTTSAADTVPAVELGPGDIHLDEVHRAVDRICCDASTDSCGDEWFEHCWTQSAESAVSFTVAFDLDYDAVRYYELAYEVPGASSSYSEIGARHSAAVWAIFSDRRDEYCVTVRARPLDGGDEVERTVCQSDAALVTLPPFEPEQPDYAACEEPPVDPDTGEELVDPSGGCSSGGGAAAWWLLLGLVLALRIRRAPAPNR